ncbi:MAG TPA: Zn-dependent hydrolase [Terriglobales bacterium]|nr:Zn-dependent hydrolase [Terriglobales bacterium]
MRILPWLFVSSLVLASMTLVAQKKTQKKTPRSYRSLGDKPVTIRMGLATDLPQQLAKWRVVRMPFHAAGLTARQRRMVEKLVDACRYLDDIYWRQSDPDGLTLFHELEGNSNRIDAEVRRMLMINGSRFDLLRDNEPFVGSQPMPPGRGFYPPGVTREQIEQYVQQHPESKAEIYSPYTVVRWQGKELVGVPYHVAFRSFLDPAARDLREAAALSDDPAFAKFLRLRADALLSDDYYPSDLAWLDLKDPKFDVIFAPYETYLDSLLGVKTSYGAAVLVRDQAESRKLALYQKYVPEIQDALPLAAEDRPSKRGLVTPMEVMDAPFRAGDLRHGYQAVADNLPNDPRIHEAKGTKKIFFKNFMDARVNYVILPVAKRVMRPDQAAKVSGEGYLAGTLLHEISHGLGPAFARTAAGKADIRESIGPTYSELEEAKADAVGMFGLKWLVDHGALPKARLQEYYASYVGGLFRTVRFGTGEAHGRAEMMEFNYLSEQKAITRDSTTGRYALDYARLPAAVEALAKELLEQEATGDRARAEAWFKKYDVMPEELKASLTKASAVPVDIDPVFSFPDQVK